MKKLYRKLSVIQKRLFWILFIGLFIFGSTQIRMSQVNGLLTALGLRIETVATISSLENYNGYGSTVHVTDSLRGGNFHYISSGLVADSGTVFPANGKGGGFWKREVININRFYATWFNAIPDGVTINDSAYAHCVSAIVANGGGVMYFPNGVYVGQIILPSLSISNFMTIEIRGEGAPVQDVGSVLAPTFTLPNNGVIIKSAATSGAVIRVSGSAISAINVVLRNLDIRTYDNPQINGVDVGWAAMFNMKDAFINTGVYCSNANYPSYKTTGLITPRQGNQGSLIMNNVSISGYYNGMTVNEHLTADGLHIYGNRNGLSILAGGHAAYIGRVDMARNVNDIFVPFVIGAVPIYISQYDVEMIDSATYTNATSAWQAQQYNIKDSINQGSGFIVWKTSPQGAKWTPHTIYVFNNNLGFQLKELAGAFSTVTSTAGSFTTLYGTAISSNSFTNSGAFTSTFGSFTSSLGLTLNSNSATSLKVTNTTSGTGSSALLSLISDASSGTASIYKYSTTTSPYKIFGSKGLGIYNATGGNINFLNDWASGGIGMGAGASSTYQFFLNPDGSLNLLSLKTGSTAPTTTGTTKTVITDANGLQSFMNTPISATVTLVAGTASISIVGVTTSSKIQVTQNNGSGDALTVKYQGVCTSGTITINAVTSAGNNTVNTADGSTMTYTVTL